MKLGVFTLAFLALCLCCIPSTASAQKNAISAQLGLGIPTGDMADAYGTGFCLQGTYLYLVSPQVRIGGTLGYKYFGLDHADGGLSTIPLMFVARYDFPGSGVKPYMGGELGLHIWSVTVKYQGLEVFDDNGSDIGLTPMFGLLIPAGTMIIDLTARLDVVFSDKTDIWIGLNAGLLFSLD